MLRFCLKPLSSVYSVLVNKVIVNITCRNERHSNKTVSIFILKTVYFVLQNMFQSLRTSSVVHIKSTVNIQMKKVCYSVTISLKIHL